MIRYVLLKDSFVCMGGRLEAEKLIQKQSNDQMTDTVVCIRTMPVGKETT